MPLEPVMGQKEGEQVITEPTWLQQTPEPAIRLSPLFPTALHSWCLTAGWDSASHLLGSCAELS